MSLYKTVYWGQYFKRIEVNFKKGRKRNSDMLSSVHMQHPLYFNCSQFYLNNMIKFAK